jgi:hypothetical protein
MSLFICFCFSSYCLIFVCWNFLSASSTPCLVILSSNAQWLLAGFLLSGCPCGHRWVPWCCLSLFCWSLELGIHFRHIPLNPVLNYIWGVNSFHSFFISSLHLVLCNYVLDRLVGGFSLLFSFPWFNFVLWLYCVCI